MRNPTNYSERQRGFTLIELAVVVSVVAVLAATLLDRVVFYQEQAEKVAMEQMVGTVRSALHLQVAALVAKGRTTDIPKLLDQNPMNWLAEKPGNYLGELFAPKPQDVELGTWYFDLQTRNLIYSVRHNAHFRADGNEKNQVRYRLQLVTAIQGSNSEADNDIEGVILEPVVPYTWF